MDWEELNAKYGKTESSRISPRLLITIILVIFVVSTILFYFFLPMNVETRELQKHGTTPEKLASVTVEAGKMTAVQPK